MLHVERSYLLENVITQAVGFRLVFSKLLHSSRYLDESCYEIRNVFNKCAIGEYISILTWIRGSRDNCKLFKFLLSHNSLKRLGYKEYTTKYRSLSRSHVKILIYRTWPIACTLVSQCGFAQNLQLKMAFVYMQD